MISAITDLREIQFVRISWKTTGGWDYVGTGRHPLFPDERPLHSPPGFQLLAQYLAMQSYQFKIPRFLPADIIIGDKPYTVRSFVGLGGSSTVYSVACGEEVHAGKVNWRESKDEVGREVSALLKLAVSTEASPNLPKLIDHNHDTIVFDPLGTPLAAYLATPGGGPSRVLKIVLDVLKALRHAHSVGLRHGDVRPANIVVADDVGVLIDFGIACSGECEGRRGKHQGLRGTAPFASDKILLWAGDPEATYSCSFLDDLESLVYVGVALAQGTAGWGEFVDAVTVQQARTRHRRFWKEEFIAALELLRNPIGDVYGELGSLLRSAMTSPSSRESSDS